jgi:cytochrome c biogenesis protein CcmG, thiol:disulfide interchange protein DsbE
MRIRTAILFGLLTIVPPVFGDDDRLPELKVGDTTYSNVLVLRVTATDIYFSSTSGISNAKLTSIEPAMQQRFSAEATKAGEIEEKQAAANAQYEQALALQAAPASAPTNQSEMETGTASLSTTNKVVAKSFLRQHGPDLPGLQWISGSPDTRDKFVLVDFWATTNELSVNFIGKLNDFLKHLGDRLVIIGISNESEDVVRNKVIDPNIEYSSALDTQNQLQTTLELTEIPYALLVDTNWIVRWEGNPLNKTNALTESTLSTLLEKYGSPPKSAEPADGSILQ